jgi:hypothetical protein
VALGLAQELALQGFLDQLVPATGQGLAYSEALGLGIDVVELKILGGTATGAASTEHVDEAFTPSLSPGLVVSPEVLGPSRHSAAGLRRRAGEIEPGRSVLTF